MRNDSQALVSVIVPIYNVEKYLDQCLDSIEAQTHRNIEVLCINDGSTDGSRAIMAAHAKKDPRVRVIDKENGGYGQGCNRGLSLAKGEWVSIIEPDDWIDPTMYEAARIDGANRAQQLWHITLPNLMFIIAVQLIMQVGSILNTNRDLILLLYRPSTYETADVIGTYVYRMGIEGGKYSYSAAVSLFMSLFGVTLTIVCNRISNKLTGYGLW